MEIEGRNEGPIRRHPPRPAAFAGHHLRGRIPALIAITMSLAFTACSSSHSSKAGPVASHGVAVTDAPTNLMLGRPGPSLCQGKKYTIGFDVFSASDAFAVATTASVKKAAESTGCVHVDTLVDNADSATAISNVKTFVTRGVSGVVLFQVIAAAQPAIAKLLDKAHIPVVVLAIPAAGEPFVNVDRLKIGQLAGKLLVDTFKARHPGQLPYVIAATFPEGGDDLAKQTSGAIEEIKLGLPNLPASHILMFDSKADPAVTYTQTRAVLGRVPKGAQLLMYELNDDTGVAMFRAIQQGGFAPTTLGVNMGSEQPKHRPITAGMQLFCKAPQFVGGVAAFPDVWGDTLIPAILGHIHNLTLPPTVFLPLATFTRANVASVFAPLSPCGS